MSFDPKQHLMSLKGKDYLQVAWRIAWMRDEHPDWAIATTMLDHDKESKTALFMASICNAEGFQLATAHGSESARDFGDYIEKAETKAVGRALAMCGFGTQFTADELDEGSRIVDSPLSKPVETISSCSDCHKPIAGKKAAGKIYTDVDIVNISTEKYGTPLCWDCMVKRKTES